MMAIVGWSLCVHLPQVDEEDLAVMEFGIADRKEPRRDGNSRVWTGSKIGDRIETRGHVDGEVSGVSACTWYLAQPPMVTGKIPRLELHGLARRRMRAAGTSRQDRHRQY